MKQEDWIKVEDRLPEDGDIVLVRCGDVRGDEITDLYFVAYYIPLIDKWVGDGLYNDFPTHWMPIVSPEEN